MIQRGDPGPLGWRTLHRVDPPELVGHPIPEGTTALATLIHSSDWHVCDPVSPARLEYLDRFFDPDHPDRAVIGPVGTYRPQEIFTRHVADSFVRAANTIERGPILQRPVDALLLTGDLIDNAQENEFHDFRVLISGGEIPPQDLSHWVGSLSSRWDEAYWHPEDSSGGLRDRPTALFGYPQVPGLLVAAEHGFHTPGSHHPWVSVHGNHDLLLQGTVGPDAELLRLATGSHRITGIAPETRPSDIVEALRQIGPARYIHGPDFPRELIGANPERSFLPPGKFRRVLRDAPGAVPSKCEVGPRPPVNAQYFAVTVGDMVLIALDTVNPHGGYHGSLDEGQLEWLRDLLAECRDTYVVISSHHPPRTLVNDYAPVGSLRRVLGPELLATLHQFGNVFAWLTGHEHENLLSVHSDGEGSVIPEITTASLIDWPQHGRMIEFGVDRHGNRVLISHTLEHSGPVMPSSGSFTVDDIASWSRLLSANDYQRRDPLGSLDRALGHDADRAFRLTLPPSRRGQRK